MSGTMTKYQAKKLRNDLGKDRYCVVFYPGNDVYSRSEDSAYCVVRRDRLHIAINSNQHARIVCEPGDPNP